MGRSKIPITWIKSDASRQVTFNKRKKGMKKKAEELAILCGVDVCMICFGPTVTGSGKHQHNNQSSTGGNNQQPQSSPGSSSSSSASANSSMSVVPFSWGMPGVSTVINKFEGLPKEERDKKKLDNTSLLEQQIKKLRRELKAKLDQNWKLEQERAYFALDERLDCYTVDELKRLADCLLEKLRITFERISYWDQQQQEQEQQHQQVVVQQEPCSGEVEEFTSNHGAKLVTSGFMSFVNPFSVLPSQQPQLNLNPLLVQPGGAPGLIMDDTENSSLLPMGIGQTSSSHLVPNNHVWSASPSEAVVTTTTYNQVGGGDEEWEQSPDENGAPMLHSMLLSAINENSDESKPETDQTDFQAQLQQEATQNDYL